MDEKFGTQLENMGEFWQLVGAAPFALDMAYQKYLQTPREYATKLMENLDGMSRLLPTYSATKRLERSRDGSANMRGFYSQNLRR